MSIRKSGEFDTNIRKKQLKENNGKTKENKKNFYLRFFILFYNFSISNFLAMSFFVIFLFIGGSLIENIVVKVYRGYVNVFYLIFAAPIFFAFIGAGLTKISCLILDTPKRGNQREFDEFDYMKFEAGLHDQAPNTIYTPVLADSIDKQLKTAIKNENKRSGRPLITSKKTDFLISDHQEDKHGFSKFGVELAAKNFKFSKKVDLNSKSISAKEIIQPEIDPYLDIAKASGNSLLGFSGRSNLDYKEFLNDFPLRSDFESFDKREGSLATTNTIIYKNCSPSNMSQNSIENGCSDGRTLIACFCYICVSERDVEMLQNGDKRCCSCKQFI